MSPSPPLHIVSSSSGPHANDKRRFKSTSPGTGNGTQSNSSGLDPRISPQQSLTVAAAPCSSSPQPQKYPCSHPGCSKEYERESYLIQHMNDKHRSRGAGLAGSDIDTQTSSSGPDPHISPQPLTAGASSSSGPQPQKYPCRYPGCFKNYEKDSYLLQHMNDKHRSQNTCSDTDNSTQTSSSGPDPRISPQQPLTTDAPSPSASGPQPQKYPCRYPGCSKEYEQESYLILHMNGKHRPQNTGSGTDRRT
jgi:K+-transporting ATPase c subunit